MSNLTKTKNKCKICESESIEEVFYISDIPVHQNLIYDSFESAKACANGKLRLFFCSTCHFLWNIDFDEKLISYEENYENDQSNSSFFKQHVYQVINKSIPFLKPSDSVLEIGCGNGYFLNFFEEQSEGLKFIGFDASLKKDINKNNINIYSRYYSPNDQSDFNFVMSRHVIEHIKSPYDFLQSIVKQNQGAIFLTETPRLEWILENNAFFDIFYEHCSYFSLRSISMLFERLNFSIIKYESAFNDQYMVVFSSKSFKADPLVSNLKETLNGNAVKEFFINFDANINKIKFEFNKRANNKRLVFLWGAGAKGTMICNLVDKDKKLLHGVIDINPKKHNKYISGTGHKIFDPSILNNLHSPVTVIIMNNNYTKEIRKQILHIDEIESFPIDFFLKK